MNNENFVFEQKRKFGDLIGDTVKFFVANLKSLLTGFLIYVGPFAVLAVLFGSYGIAAIDITAVEADPLDFMVSMLGLLAFWYLAALAVYAFSYAFVQKYRTDQVTPVLEGIFPYITRVLGRLVPVVLLISLLAISFIVIWSIVISTMGVGGAVLVVLLSFPVIIYVSVPLLLTPYVYINEEVSVFQAISRSFHLVKGHWWETFGLILVIGLINSTISSIIFYPAYISSFLDTLSNPDTLPFENPSLFLQVSIALGGLVSLFLTIAQVLSYVLQYFNLRERKEGVGLRARIESIDVED